ncbi:MAG: hypothetical protein M3O34_11440 [Chloroflexota bacterium]|nr:hypothetical protein [Chloroflexota bacterium]
MMRVGTPPVIGATTVLRRERDGGWLIVPVLVYAMLIATYFVVRLGGRTTEIDTAWLTLSIRSVALSGDLTPDTGFVYGNGYAYTAISNAILAFTGLSIATLQQLVYPATSALLVFPAWALYRELTGSVRVAALATLLLFMQPEFLFVVMRGSHERVLRALMLVMLWLLVRSFRFREQPGHFAVHVALFYLTAYALIATNALFGVSFAMAVATAMALAFVLGRWRSSLIHLASGTASRLLLVLFAVTALGFTFVYYIYPLSGQGLLAVGNLGQQVLALLLTLEGGTNPYAQVVTAWTSLPVYLLLSSGDFLLILLAGGIWIGQGIRWLRGENPATLSVWLLWLFCGAFAFQGALSIVTDRAGLLGGNLQHRSFPSFALVAMPLVATALVDWGRRRWARLMIVAGLAVLAVTGVLKATNEPALSNKWTFYAPSELQALAWADRYVDHGAVWVGFDERLSTAYTIGLGREARDDQWDIYDPKPATRAFLITNVVRLQGQRLGKPLPTVGGENQLYDSGLAELYRLRPRTPYQR